LRWFIGAYDATLAQQARQIFSFNQIALINYVFYPISKTKLCFINNVINYCIWCVGIRVEAIILPVQFSPVSEDAEKALI
jgi:hypothetical protein